MCWYFARKQLHVTTAESQQRGKQNIASSHGGSMETLFNNDNNLSVSQKSFTNQQQWGDKVSGEAIEMAQIQVESQWKMQGKDVLASNKINVFTGTWLPLLRIPFSADHSMDITKNSFWGARTLVGPNLVHKRRQKSMFKMTLPWKGVSLIWKGPLGYLVSLCVFNNVHRFPQANVRPLQYMFNIAVFFFSVAHISF